MLKCGSKARRKARSGEYHECACPRFGPSARVRRTGLGVCRRRDRRPVAAPEEAVAEIFLRCRGIGAVRADHGTPGILSDPHRTRYPARAAATRSRTSSRKARRWWNSAPARPPRSACCWNAAISAPTCLSTYPAISLSAQAEALRKDFPALVFIRWPRTSPRHLLCPPISPACRRSASFRDRRSAISSRMKPAPSCAARARFSAKARR